MKPGDLAETHHVPPPRLPTIAYGSIRVGDLVWSVSTGEPCLVTGLAEDPTYVIILRGGELRSIHYTWLSKYATAG
jgi:hypothetical protein